jgi:hypothetical protein
MSGIEVMMAGANAPLRKVSCHVRTTPIGPKPSGIVLVSCCGDNIQKENERSMEKRANATHPQSLELWGFGFLLFFGGTTLMPQKNVKAAAHVPEVSYAKSCFATVWCGNTVASGKAIIFLHLQQSLNHAFADTFSDTEIGQTGETRQLYRQQSPLPLQTSSLRERI